ncbi:MAG: hypothetical protein ACYSWT_08530 [Planctomycetota bacterium]
MAWLKACLVVYWLSLVVWLAALAAAGLCALYTFGTLGSTPLVLEQFATYPAPEHGKIAAGLVMADLFFTVDCVQFVAIPAALIMLGLQLTVLGLPARRPSNLIRLGCGVLAAGLFAYYAVAVAPPLNGALRAYWDAAAAGDLEAAGRGRDLVAAYHSTARVVLQLNLALVTGAVAASAVALGPSARSKSGLPEPQLLKHQR